MKSRFPFRLFAWLLGGLILGSSPSPGAAATMEELQAQLSDMANTITQLQSTIQQMQTQINEQKTMRTESVAGPSRETSEVEKDVLTLRERMDQLVKITGYYDLEYANDDKKGSPSEFKQHHLSIFFDKRIQEWHFFSEIEFEYAPHAAGTGGAVTGYGEIIVETTWLEWNHSDEFNIRGGLLLLPQHWTINHYPSTTVSTSRPLLVKRVFPFDTNGVSVYGTHYFDNDWGGTYNVFIGNGEAADPANNDANENKVVGGKLTAHIPLFDRFDVSGSTYIGENASTTYEVMWGAETQINIGNFELLTEIAQNNPEGNAASELGYYVQPSYRFLPKWTAFYRLDSRDDSSLIDDPDDAVRHTTGVRYQPIPAISLKAEVFRDTPDNRTREEYSGFLGSAVIFF